MPESRRTDRIRLTADSMVGGRYRVEEPLGRGGMAQVYAAWDQLLERRVALKVASADVTGDPESAARFAAEARIAAGLNHPGLVAVFDAGVDGTLAYLVMEHVDGRTLSRVLREERITPDRAVAIVASVAGALEAIHTRGFVHRDVKPGNVLVADDGTIKVADFGIAGSMRSPAAASGMVHGTPGYAAPEQLRGDPVDGRADLYGLSVVLYELLTGRLPFDADSSERRGPGPPSRAAPTCPPGLDAVVLTALSWRPEDRYPTAAAFRDALLQALRDPSDPPTVPIVRASSGRTGAGAHRTARPHRRRGAVAVAAIAVLLLAGAWVAAGTPFLERPARDGLSPSPVPSAGPTAPAALVPTARPPAAADAGEQPAGANDHGGHDEGDEGPGGGAPCDNSGPGNCENRADDHGEGSSG